MSCDSIYPSWEYRWDAYWFPEGGGYGRSFTWVHETDWSGEKCEDETGSLPVVTEATLSEVDQTTTFENMSGLLAYSGE